MWVQGVPKCSGCFQEPRYQSRESPGPYPRGFAHSYEVGAAWDPLPPANPMDHIRPACKATRSSIRSFAKPTPGRIPGSQPPSRSPGSHKVSSDAEVCCVGLGGASLPSSCRAAPGRSLGPESAVLGKLLHGHPVSLCCPVRITASTASSWWKTCPLRNGERESEHIASLKVC